MSVARRNAAAPDEADSVRGDLMKAIVQDRFGPPDTLQLADTEKPEIRSGEVLLKVHAASVNPYDWHMIRGDPRIARLMGGVGLTKPKTRIAGVDVAGRVQAVGADVDGLRVGDEVFGSKPDTHAARSSSQSREKRGGADKTGRADYGDLGTWRQGRWRWTS